jgi:hypothetical protein
MNKVVLSFILVNVLVIGLVSGRVGGVADEAGKRRLFIDQDLNSVALLEMTTGGRCTAFVVDAHVIASAAHCVKSETRYIVTYEDGRQAEAVLIKAGEPGTETDWALFYTNTYDIKPLEFPLEPPQWPVMCTSVGYGGDAASVQKTLPCMTLGTDKDPFIPEAMIIVGEVDYGDSGGPLLGYNNTILGIVFALDRIDSQRGYAVPYWILQKAIQDLKAENLWPSAPYAP